MNANKRSFGWILCPSKTFPGKFYYFNTMNGEAVWSVSDVEKRTMIKNDYLHRVTDRWHNYPEPDSPPMEENPSSFQSWSVKRPEYNIQKQDNYNRQFVSQSSPMSGQVFSEPYVPNMWPGQMPRPMIASPKKPYEFAIPWQPEREPYFQNPERVVSKRYIQFDKPPETHENFFNSNFCGSLPPIQNQTKWTFGCQNNRLAFAPMQSNPKVYDQSMNRHIFRQKQNYSAPVFQKKPHLEFTQKSVLREPIFNRVVNQSESQYNRRNENIFRSPFEVNLRASAPANDNIHHRLSDFNQNSFKSEPNTNWTSLRSAQNTDNSAGLDLSNLSLQSGLSFSKVRNKNFTTTNSNENFIAGNSVFQRRCVQSSKKVADNIECFDKAMKRSRVATISEDVNSELNKGDLRYTLLAKRRKSVDIGELQKSAEQKKIKTHYTQDDKPAGSNKRVTFNLDTEVDESSVIEETCEEPTNVSNSEKDPTIMALRSLADPPVTTSWYIVADTEALLQDYEFLEAFVQSDDKCILLIPLAVRREVEALSVGDWRGRQRVLSARQVSRRLAAPPRHVAVQLAEEDTTAHMTVEDLVLQCCLQAMNEYHVVLLTNNEQLYEKAESMEVYCYILQSIKDEAAIERPEVSFELKKMPTVTKNIGNLTTAKDTSTRNEMLDNTLSLQFKNDFNPFTSNKSEIPVNCFRKRLFEEQKDENIVNPFLFQRKNDKMNLKTPADCKKTEFKRVFAPKKLQISESLPSDETSDVINSSFSGLQRFNSLTKTIEALNLKENTTQNNIDFFRSHTSTDQYRNRIETEKSIQQNIDENPRENIPKEITYHTFNDIDISDINSYNLDEHLKMFQVKTERMMERIKGKIEEWICSYTQIMEDTLSDILQSDSEPQSNKLPAPWSLPEAVECVREMFSRHALVRIVVEKLSALLFNCSCKKGKLKNTTKPNDFMKILGCGVLLVQCFKSALPDTPSLMEAETSLSALLRSILDPSTDAEPPRAPPALLFRDSDEHNTGEKQNFVKSPADIARYLKKHFSGWQSYDEDLENLELFQPKTNQNRANLNAFKLKPKPIDNRTTSQSYPTTRAADETVDPEATQNLPRITRSVTQKLKQASSVEKDTGAKLLRNLAINSGRFNIKLKDIDLEARDKVNKELTFMIENMTNGKVCPTIIDTQKHENKVGNDNIVPDSNQIENRPQIIRKFHFPSTNKPAQTTKSQENNSVFDITDIPKPKAPTGPKFIRKKKTIDNTEDKQNENGILDLDALDYSDFDENAENDNENNDITSRNDENEHSGNVNSQNKMQVNDNDARIIDKTQVNDNVQVNDMEVDTTNDSGIENESQQAYLVAKMFLAELTSSLEAVHRFIASCANEFGEMNVLGDKRRRLRTKATWIHSRVAEIVTNLRRIIERESSAGGATICNLIAKAGGAARGDERVLQYKQVVMKCLEQAQLLADALRTTVSLTDADYDAITNSVSSNMQYYNIV